MVCKSPLRLKNGLLVPCGHCTPCHIAYAAEWTTRLMLEYEYWDVQDCCFLTLTYDDLHYPINGSLVPKHLASFIDTLRERMRRQGCKIKYYACGEYGDKSNRPHYHLILFGVGYDEMRTDCVNGQYVNQLPLVSDIWPYGSHFVGSVTSDSCRYVADYVQKAYSGDLLVKLYTSKGLVVPFRRSSRGIGLRWFVEHRDDVIKDGYIRIKGIKRAVPKYFIRKLCGDLPKLYALLKFYRAKLKKFDNRLKNPMFSRDELKERINYITSLILSSSQDNKDVYLNTKLRAIDSKRSVLDKYSNLVLRQHKFVCDDYINDLLVRLNTERGYMLDQQAIFKKGKL